MKFEGQMNYLNSVALSPSSLYLASGSITETKLGSDEIAINIWDIRSGKRLH